MCDFFVLGAQKSGTTTLFEALRRTDGVSVPPSKEFPVLADPNIDDGAAVRALDSAFVGAKGIRGTITPQYLTSPLAHRRLRQFYPSARYVVVLREPLARAFSHYRMEYRRGSETRSFNDALREELEDTQSVKEPDRRLLYVSGSSYGSWLQAFDPDGTLNIQVLWTDDLSSDLDQVCTDLLQFVDGQHTRLSVPPDLQIRANQGGDDGSMMQALRFARMIPGYGWLVDKVPIRYKHTVAFRLEAYSRKPAPAAIPELDPDVSELAIEYFRTDAIRLQNRSATPPWIKLYAGEGAE